MHKLILPILRALQFKLKEGLEFMDCKAYRLGYRDKKWIIICASTSTRVIRVYGLQSID